MKARSLRVLRVRVRVLRVWVNADTLL